MLDGGRNGLRKAGWRCGFIDKAAAAAAAAAADCGDDDEEARMAGSDVYADTGSDGLVDCLKR